MVLGGVGSVLGVCWEVLGGVGRCWEEENIKSSILYIYGWKYYNIHIIDKYRYTTSYVYIVKITTNHNFKYDVQFTHQLCHAGHLDHYRDIFEDIFDEHTTQYREGELQYALLPRFQITL